MKYKIHHVIFLFVFPFCFFSCIKNNFDSYKNNPIENYNALWKIVDEKYCFFKDKNIDWNKAYSKYKEKISDKTSEDSLFNIMSELLNELKDGHVNLVSDFNISRYTKWFSSYEQNFNANIQRNYLRDNYKIAGSISYQMFNNQIAYLYIPSFSAISSAKNIIAIEKFCMQSKGIIIDVRGNGGGDLDYAYKLASFFFKEKTVIGYIQHKTGPGHDQFSNPYPVQLKPIPSVFKKKPVCILTNRKCFSATNAFIAALKYAASLKQSDITIVGDKSGGGGGLPFTYDLPNGWKIRLSTSRVMNIKKEELEQGVDPNIKINMKKSDAEKGLDTIIEKAKEIILSKVSRSK